MPVNSANEGTLRERVAVLEEKVDALSKRQGATHELVSDLHHKLLRAEGAAWAGRLIMIALGGLLSYAASQVLTVLRPLWGK